MPIREANWGPKERWTTAAEACAKGAERKYREQKALNPLVLQRRFTDRRFESFENPWSILAQLESGFTIHRKRAFCAEILGHHPGEFPDTGLERDG